MVGPSRMTLRSREVVTADRSELSCECETCTVIELYLCGVCVAGDGARRIRSPAPAADGMCIRGASHMKRTTRPGNTKNTYITKHTHRVAESARLPALFFPILSVTRSRHSPPPLPPAQRVRADAEITVDYDV